MWNGMPPHQLGMEPSRKREAGDGQGGLYENTRGYRCPWGRLGDDSGDRRNETYRRYSRLDPGTCPSARAPVLQRGLGSALPEAGKMKSNARSGNEQSGAAISAALSSAIRRKSSSSPYPFSAWLDVAMLFCNLTRACACGSPDFSPSPILFCFSFHCGRLRIFALDPIWRAAGTISRILALRNDPLQPELAGVLEYKRPVFLVHMLIEPHAGSGATEHAGER